MKNIPNVSFLIQVDHEKTFLVLLHTEYITRTLARDKKKKKKKQLLARLLCMQDTYVANYVERQHPDS